MLKTIQVRLATAVAATLLALVIAGCGQSGPLYLPGNPSEVQVPPQEPAEPAPPEEDDEDESRPAQR